jgi:anti-sigma regulatory factor (Ser/Thr protein kinase)
MMRKPTASSGSTLTAKSITLPGVLTSAAKARRFTASVLAAAGHGDTSVAELVASELVANGIEHSQSGLPGGTVVLTVTTASGEWAQVEVRDAGPAAPGGRPAVPAQAPPPEAERGRGLLLVSQFALDYGTAGDGTAWARLAWEAAEPVGDALLPAIGAAQ